MEKFRQKGLIFFKDECVRQIIRCRLHEAGLQHLDKVVVDLCLIIDDPHTLVPVMKECFHRDSLDHYSGTAMEDHFSSTRMVVPAPRPVLSGCRRPPIPPTKLATECNPSPLPSDFVV